MASFGEQCHLVNNAVMTNDPILHNLIQTIIVYAFAILGGIAGYTVIVFFIAYKFGFYNAQHRVTTNKMTMTSVTYTAVRGVKHPTFEYKPDLCGCWT